MIVAKRKTSYIYHRKNCRFVQNVNEELLDYFDPEDNELFRYRPCKCCYIIKNYYNAELDQINHLIEKQNMKIKIADKNHIFVTTENDVWRIGFRRKDMTFSLWKRNKLSHGKGLFEEVIDCKRMNSITSVFQFIDNYERNRFVPEGFRFYYDRLLVLGEGQNFMVHTDENHLYIITDMAVWKFVYNDFTGQFGLFHHPFCNENEKTEDISSFYFHRQKDVPMRKDFYKNVKYIVRHDKAKKTIQDDYRRLPRKTKKQKMYYEQAKRKEHRKNVNRVLELFDSI